MDVEIKFNSSEAMATEIEVSEFPNEFAKVIRTGKYE